LSIGWSRSASKRRATEMLRADPLNEIFPLAEMTPPGIRPKN